MKAYYLMLIKAEPCTCRWREGTIGRMQVYQELRKATARDCCHEADSALCSEATGGRRNVALLSMLPLTGARLLQGLECWYRDTNNVSSDSLKV